MTLSKEELRSIIDSDHVQCGDAAIMARELLERRERDKREPVGWTDKRNLDYINKRGRETALMWSSQNYEHGDTALYADQPAQPVAAPEELLSIAERLVDRYIANKGTESEFIACLTPGRSSVGTGGVWDDWKALDAALSACRAAMLNGGQS